jgi:hypothetical protein
LVPVLKDLARRSANLQIRPQGAAASLNWRLPHSRLSTSQRASRVLKSPMGSMIGLEGQKNDLFSKQTKRLSCLVKNEQKLEHQQNVV